MPSKAYYIGLMSGTSMDGIDAALIELTPDGAPGLIGHHCHPYPTELRRNLAALCQPGDNEIDRLGELDIQVGETFAEATLQLIKEHACRREQIRAIGSHGQTLRHRPGVQHPFSLQIGDANTIAQRTGITTVADFRRRDISAGGQGAPLVPAFHQAIFQSGEKNRVILNIGGIANITWLPSNSAEPATGFDTGPGNTLLDHWITRHRQVDFDRHGAWGETGRIIPSLLDRMMTDAYFSRSAPKSTGTEYFNLDWLDAMLGEDAELATSDVQATLIELTALTIADAISLHCPVAEQLLVCGGGVHNGYLMGRLAANLPSIEVFSTAKLSVDPDWIEAMAFAWLAHRTLEGLPGNLPSVTGAREAVVLGGIYPAGLSR
ncbi:MAG: anhydro-N-acetylmuramic acid kinase [gamma proteobacterium endosymbiont of Lamellibrachia anaximandri]|nr:anhydro-N-acetylmuramic acid kinase [gamma proteobacterium endosymbiont of Lamellibrachia anaximandri]MBL3532790.1 anhydro-N-acetylmuramic acid kinase [gamma proteobacterium endosymbiont of Lamellibrachia anaximandri]